ncbi:ABC transporter permease [Chryseolinea soli]|uniref:FtsX-like permease family protein n=1 Tax=Chryseolinea soli TaxID=2321403 RepID=A0A385SIF9_9BACT|nr:ABC transporter permease [Chryseolinea soli]AYB29705.1 FtsX-like permease family protein [Chryseolinea soli]
MLHHYLLLSFRNFRRFKSSFLINLTGLSSGMVCALLIYLWVSDELAIDRIFNNDDRLYQVIKTYPNADGTVSTGEETPSPLAAALLDDMPEVEHSVATIARDPGILSVGEKRMKARPQYVDKDFFEVLPYPVLQGDRKAMLKDKYGVVISDKLAFKLFNTTENIVGKTVAWEGENVELNGAYTIAGVFQSPPENATWQFDILFTHAVYYDTFRERFGLAYWGSNSSHTYVVLKPGTDIVQFNEKIKDYSKAQYKARHGSEGLEWEGRIFLQSYSSKYLHNAYDNGVPSGGRIEYVKLFSIIAVFILAIACINFMNLSTAQAARRMKEIGIKKAIGVARQTLLYQYLCESICMALLSLVLAVGLVLLLLPVFNDITGKGLALHFTAGLVWTMVAVTLLTGVFAGSYPAFYLSGFRPATVLKGKLDASTGESWVRKGLVVFQFGIALLLIVSVLVVYKQMEFIQKKNLGYNKDNIIVFTNEGKLRAHMDAFITEVKRIPGVVNASSMGGNFLGNNGGGGGIDWEGKQPGQGIEFDAVYADYGLIELMDLKMKEGRAFSRQSGSDKDNVIFNETAIAAMNLKDPVGKTVVMWGKKKQIIGIVKDFHYESLYEKVKPFFFRMAEEEGDNQEVLVKIKAGTEPVTLEKIRQYYQSFNEGLPFTYRFMDDDYQKLYASEERVARLSRYFAGIAMLISCLGLFGLAAYTAERRMKEIGIRKVLGSSVAGIVYLLSGEFAKIVAAAILIALPLSYVLASQWLSSFAFRIALEPWYFLTAALLTLLVAWFTVGALAIKAAKLNPATILRME